MLAAVLPNADPLHKVTILPTGMALGVTQQMPRGTPQLHSQAYIEDSLVHAPRWAHVRRPRLRDGVDRRAERPRRATPSSRARWSASGACSDRIGPMAWGSQGQVFLGEDLMHTRDYSDETARVIDEEVERILRVQEDRARELLDRAPSGPRSRRAGAARARDDRRRRGVAPRAAGPRRGARRDAGPIRGRTDNRLVRLTLPA